MGTESKGYNDYVFSDGRFVGDFERMYADVPDPWHQSKDILSSEKVICLKLIEMLERKKVVEFGSGLGYFTKQLTGVAEDVVGVEISSTAVEKAMKLNPRVSFRCAGFPDFDFLRLYEPDCIVLAEITWYVLKELDAFIDFLKTEMPNTLLIHLLTTYEAGQQKYGVEKFTNIQEITAYFDMPLFEYGEIRNPSRGSGAKTYFAGSYASTFPCST